MVAVRYQTAFTLYPYEKVAEQDAANPARHPVVIVGGGPVGMGLALDLGKKGVPCLVLDDHDGVGRGSRAICFAKRTLEICDRLGCGDPMVDKGVVWNVGRVYRDEKEVYTFNLLPEDGHKRPAFINLQQPYFEQFLVEEIRRQQAAGAPIEIRGKNCVTALTQHGDHVALEVDTPDGPYQLEADYLVACDGASSPTRAMMGLDFEGRVFEDNFLIADIKMKAEFPVERRFWFNPSFNRGETALMHKQPDDVWRLDFQLGWDIDREAELKPERISERVAAMIGEGIEFELVWTSIYTFRCCTMKDYRHDRVLFAGDAAHQVSPFGARGANGGMQDIDNLGWKLAAVINGHADDTLLNSYHEERKYGAMENIKNSSRSADFLTPRNPAHRLFRDAVLDLVEDHDFARPLVNSGRLSMPCTYDGSNLNTADALPDAPARSRPGSACSDAPLSDGFLLDQLGAEFTLLTINCDLPADLTLDGPSVTPLILTSADDPTGALQERYLGDAKSAVYLIRPDQHVVGRWADFDETRVGAALARALGKT
ncbi:FAD-dependent oxidoreductase [Pacificibacter marinus]|uniref:FAD-dependent oxidoreductase n=1 Tax=Pacificibacter marinus TaxID=658057 RepID=UPI001C064B5E|nr:FAD-dependent oxidoreductase [Pacificibacter marinus]MBU2867588.1 FAD-dependent oxidoreductase [Pacificibacter marinus]